jgi:hypothetical protein
MHAAIKRQETINNTSKNLEAFVKLAGKGSHKRALS